MLKIHLIQTSVSTMSQARSLAADLMDARLAACVQIQGPGLSFYRWQGKLEQSEEYYLSIKTTPSMSSDVVTWLQQHHPYELPEMIQAELDTTKAYADWVHAACDT